MRKSVKKWASPFFGDAGGSLSFTSDLALASKEELRWSGFCWASSDQCFRPLPSPETQWAGYTGSHAFCKNGKIGTRNSLQSHVWLGNFRVTVLWSSSLRVQFMRTAVGPQLSF